MTTEYREKPKSDWQKCHECKREFRNKSGKTYDWNGEDLCPSCDDNRGHW